MPSSVRDVYLAYLLRQWEGSSCIVFTSTCKVRMLFGGGACCCWSSGKGASVQSELTRGTPCRVHVAERSHAASTWQNVAMRRPRGRRASSSRQRSLRSASNARRSTHNSRRCLPWPPLPWPPLWPSCPDLPWPNHVRAPRVPASFVAVQTCHPLQARRLAAVNKLKQV